MTFIERRRFLRNAVKWTAAVGAGSFLPAMISGCRAIEEITRVGTEIGTSTGMMTQDSADSIRKSTKAVSKSFEDITPEQEYYIGRSIGAVILEKYPPDTDDAVNLYLNQVGQTLARASDMPETYGGYHFLCQNSQEINALSAPGGLIFVTRGILECCQNETAVAAVLAHEIGHVQSKHGLRAIKNSRITKALVTIGIESAKAYGPQELADLTQDFEGSIDDISQTLINSGYSRAYEFEADRAAITIMRRVGYNPAGLVEMLQVMRQKLVPDQEDFSSTHPSPESRILEIKSIIGLVPPVKEVRERQMRFESALKNI
jgi:beta-barrel assembly-enhancing protease